MGGTPGNSWWWCAVRFSKSWPYFRPKNIDHFPYPFSDLSFRHKSCYHWLSLERKQNKSNTVRIRFLSYSFGIETLNTFIYSRSSLENHTRFKTKVGKVYTIHPFISLKWLTDSFRSLMQSGKNYISFTSQIQVQPSLSNLLLALEQRNPFAVSPKC